MSFNTTNTQYCILLYKQSKSNFDISLSKRTIARSSTLSLVKMKFTKDMNWYIGVSVLDKRTSQKMDFLVSF